jgi:RNA polymerase sigma factor (TIGR02999 family)
MSDVTRILSAIDEGDPRAANELLPLIYDELRQMARQRLAQEAPGHTLQPTALVHEAWLRLGDGRDGRWDSRRHFFAAAAEAMRRILVESARRKQALKRGGDRRQLDLEELEFASPAPCEEVLAVDDALRRLEDVDPTAARFVKLRYFSGMTVPEAAQTLGVSPRTGDRIWSYARTWLFREIGGDLASMTPPPA